jgi:hypothetical protein
MGYEIEETKDGERLPMLRSLRDLEGYAVNATDGDIGSVSDFFLSDDRWVVRYLVAETGGFFSGRQVLISPIAFRQVDWSTRRFHLALTRDKVKNSPSVDLDKPVSRQHELALFGYYEYPYYWGYAGLWGKGAHPRFLADGTRNQRPAAAETGPLGDAQLRSSRKIRGYHIEGTDAAIGHVVDFIVEDETWEVRYMVVDTRNWWLDKKVLVDPHWTSHISWAEKKVFVDLTRQSIKDSPKWDAAAPIDREYEARLYDYYGRPVYWDHVSGRQRTTSHHRPGRHLG